MAFPAAAGCLFAERSWKQWAGFPSTRSPNAAAAAAAKASDEASLTKTFQNPHGIKSTRRSVCKGPEFAQAERGSGHQLNQLRGSEVSQGQRGVLPGHTEHRGKNRFLTAGCIFPHEPWPLGCYAWKMNADRENKVKQSPSVKGY